MTDQTDRLSGGMTNEDAILALGNGNAGATTLLTRIVFTEPNVTRLFAAMDTKRLYGGQIWRLFKLVCGGDMERFKYHLCVELPNQETGELIVMGPYGPPDDPQFWEKRRFGTPGAMWALEHPPYNPDYAYPIV